MKFVNRFNHLIAYIVLIISVVSFSLFLSFRHYVNTAQLDLVAKEAVLDLTNFDFHHYKFARITGQAEFYWDQLIYPEEFNCAEPIMPDTLLDICGVWNNHVVKGKTLTGSGFATYHFKVLFPEDGQYGIKIKEFDCAYRVFVNGNLYVECGKVGKSPETAVASWRRHEIYFSSVNKQADVVIQVANFWHRKGGPEDVMVIGSERSIYKYKKELLGLSFFLFGIFLIGFFYHLALYIFRPVDKTILYFAIFIFLVTIRLLTVGEKLIYELLPGINWMFATRLEYLSFILSVPFFVWFIYAFYPNLVSKIVSWIISAVSGCIALVVVIFPAKIFTYTPIIYQLVVVLSSVYLLYILLRAVYLKYEYGIFLLGGYLFYCFVAINDILYYNKIYGDSYLMPLGLFVFTFSHSFVLARKSSKSFADVEQLSLQLDTYNRELEAKVKLRTTEVLKQKEEIEEQKAELEAQADSLVGVYEQLVELNKFKDGLTSMIVHDLKNPLNVILNLSKDSIVLYSANRMLNLVQNMLDIQKYENARMVLQKERMSFAETVEKAVAQIAIILQKKGVILVNNVHTDLQFEYDENIMIRVLVNLLSNAIKHTPATGRITLSYRALPNEIRFMVEDTGIGIPKDKHDLIFLKYGQILQKKLEKSDSTGLGLAFCKLAIEAHDGKIGFNSEEGKGSTFWFEIPCLNCRQMDTINIEHGHIFEETSIAAVVSYLRKIKQDSDSSYLKFYIDQLKEIQIYEVSTLKGVLKTIDLNFSAVVYIWVKKLYAVVDSIDEIGYYKLLEVF